MPRGVLVRLLDAGAMSEFFAHAARARHLIALKGPYGVFYGARATSRC